MTIRVRLTPKAAEDAIDGVEPLADESLVVKARVRAVPEKGAANAALEELVAGALGVSKSKVKVAAGPAARVKTLVVAGEPGALVEALEEICG